MQRQRRRHRTKCPDRQLELFAPNLPARPATTPGWTALPEETRRVVEGLMARLLVDHAKGAASELPEAADDL